MDERDFVVRKRCSTSRAQEDHAHRTFFVGDRYQCKRRELEAGLALAHRFEQRMASGVADHQRVSGPQDFADFRVLAQVDRQIAEPLVVAGGDHVTRGFRIADQNDAATIDVRNLGHAAHDREQDVADVERRSERLRQLEHGLRVPFSAAQAFDVIPHAHLAADAGDQLGRPERLMDVVVGAGRKDALNFLVRVERGQDQNRGLGELTFASNETKHREAIGLGHHQIEQHQRGNILVEPRDGGSARVDRGIFEPGRFQRLDQYVPTHSIVVHDQNRGVARHL